VRNLPDEQLKHITLFMAAQHATLALWAMSFIPHDPVMEKDHEEWRIRGRNDYCAILNGRENEKIEPPGGMPGGSLLRLCNSYTPRFSKVV
jgi:hypothetical protein